MENEIGKIVSMSKSTQFASTLPKPHMPTLRPELCQRASKANPNREYVLIKIKKPAYNNVYNA